MSKAAGEGRHSMAHVEKFSPNYYYSLEKQDDYVLRVWLDSSYPYVYCKYDFLGRVMFVGGSSSDKGATTAIPFSQLDTEALEFFHAQLVKLGGKPPALPDALSKETSETWVRMGSKAIAHVGVYPEMQRKLTDIFNFESRQHFMVTESLKTHAEITTQPVSFDSLSPATLEKALEEFTKAGGAADKDFVLRGAANLKGKSPLRD
ncbi:MAG: hypothetical protein K8R48_05505 [Alphaproteobacteria bacterium]|nr:hypothetical protein [Alphaproteobacteria bacterium]